jgi:hypothetical protein
MASDPRHRFDQQVRVDRAAAVLMNPDGALGDASGKRSPYRMPEPVVAERPR